MMKLTCFRKSSALNELVSRRLKDLSKSNFLIVSFEFGHSVSLLTFRVFSLFGSVSSAYTLRVLLS